ncbi:MAG: replication-relaxation family protein [Nocardioidaceae bacterium]|nr:replication-relaxation family protein [Nocardioidaceae bacterium]
MPEYTPGQGLPLGLPIGTPNNLTSSQVTDVPDELRGTNTPISSSSGDPGRLGARDGQPQRRVTHRRLSSIVEQMVDRDHAVLRQIAQHRFLTTVQLQHLVFTGHETDASAARTTRRVLSRLERWGLIRMLHRRVGGARAGSTARIWQLAPGGARLVQSDGATYRTSEPSLRFLRHCLAVGDVHVLLSRHRAIETIEDIRVEVEPDCWRRYTGPGGEPKWLQPDLAATIATADYEDRWFIEVDLGTESLPTLLRKCGHYETYLASGQEQQAHGSFPLVLWVFSDPSRARRLREAVAKTPRLTPELYRFAVPHTVASVLSGGSS